jgi:hypothetical protein
VNILIIRTFVTEELRGPQITFLKLFLKDWIILKKVYHHYQKNEKRLVYPAGTAK